MKHVGILAHSTEGAALCFLAFCQEGFRRLGRNEHPDVTLDYIAFGYSMPAASPLPTLDSTRLLAHAAFDVATGERAMPRWRGGPAGG